MPESIPWAPERALEGPKGPEVQDFVRDLNSCCPTTIGVNDATNEHLNSINLFCISEKGQPIGNNKAVTSDCKHLSL